MSALVSYRDEKIIGKVTGARLKSPVAMRGTLGSPTYTGKRGGRQFRRAGCSEIVRFAAGFPFDVAADARLLRRGKRFAGEDRVERGAQIFAGDRKIVAGTAVIQLTAIDEAMALVEEEKIRRARGAIGFGDSLRLIVKIRKSVPRGLRFLFHFFRT